MHRKKFLMFVTTDPANPPAGGGTPPADPPNDPPNDPPAPKTEELDGWNLKDAVAEITKLRKENGKERTNAKTKAADEARKDVLSELTKALGLDSKTPTVEEVTGQLTEATNAKTAAEQRADNSDRMLAVYLAAQAVNGDPAALTDSSSFMRSIADIDPTDTDAIKEKVKEAVNGTPRFKTGPQTGTGYRVEQSGTGKPGKPMTMAQAIQAKLEGN